MTPQLQMERDVIAQSHWTGAYRTWLIEMHDARLENRKHFDAEPQVDRDLPVVLLVGPSRSGTTRMQRLLSSDPQFQFLSLRRCIHPFTDATVDMAWYSGQQALHVLDQDHACEMTWLMASLGRCGYPFGAAEASEDMGMLLREMRQLAAMICDSRPLVMKTTTHLSAEWLRQFFAEFPRTRMIFTLRRDQSARWRSAHTQYEAYDRASNRHYVASADPAVAPDRDNNAELLRDWGEIADGRLFWMEDLIAEPARIAEVYRALGYACPQSVIDMAQRNEKF